MAEPVTMTVSAIATLAFQKFVEAGSGELAKRFTAGAIAKMDELRQKIWQKLRGQPVAEAALTKVEQGSKAELDQVTACLQEAMGNDPNFAQEIRQLAQEIQQEINIRTIQGKNVQNVYSGEAFQVNDPNSPVIQGVSGGTININYGQPPHT